MKLRDYLMAVPFALAILIVNVALSFAVMFVYGEFIDPGHDMAYYTAKAQQIAPWSSIFFGIPLFATAAFFLARLRPARPALLMAVAIWTAYVVIDLAMLSLAGVPLNLSVAPLVGISSLTKLGAALAGALWGKASTR